MTEINRDKNRISRHRRWRRLWFPMLVILLGLMSWSRGLWWPRPFQAAARQALSEHENTDALAWLDWATWLAPEDGETAFLRARAHRRMENMSQSRAAIQRARRSHVASERHEREEWLCLGQMGQWQNVDRHLSELLKDPRGDSEEIHEAIFVGCIHSHRHAEALDILESWIHEFPTHARPYLQRAKFWGLKSKTSQAIEDFRRVLELSPENMEAVVELATMLQSRNRFNEAIPLFERSLKVPRFVVRAHIGLATCLKSVGETHRVRLLLVQAEKHAHDNPLVLCELGRLDLESGHYAEAVIKLTEAVRVAPRDEDCHFVLAQALVANEQRNKAKPHLEFVQKKRDDLGEMNRCEDLLRKNPRDVEALVTSGSIQIRGDDPDEGVARLLAVLSMEPKNATARRLMADHFTRYADKSPEYRKLAERFRDP